MAQAVRDDNFVPAKLASNSGTTIRLLVDHATGYLKCKIVPSTLVAPTVVPTAAVRDENYVTGAMADYNGTAKPLFVTHSGNYLRAVIA